MRSGLTRKATEEEFMTINLIDVARDTDPFAPTGEGEQALLRLLARRRGTSASKRRQP
jgi:hypothetical protein